MSNDRLLAAPPLRPKVPATNDDENRPGHLHEIHKNECFVPSAYPVSVKHEADKPERVHADPPGYAEAE